MSSFSDTLDRLVAGWVGHCENKARIAGNLLVRLGYTSSLISELLKAFMILWTGGWVGGGGWLDIVIIRQTQGGLSLSLGWVSQNPRHLTMFSFVFCS